MSYENRILRSFTSTLGLTEIPSEGDLLVRIRAHLRYFSGNLRFLFRLALTLFELGGLFYRGRPFSFLNPSQQAKYLEFWREIPFYPFRLLFQFLRTVSYMNYYSHPAINQKMGFEPPQPKPRSRPLPLPETPQEDLFLKADVCVIGSGAGGAVVAKELALKGRSVVLLEEGGSINTHQFGKDPLEILQKLYRNTGLQVTMGLPCIVIPTGRAVGGTTVINSGTCFRLPDEVLQRWQNEFGLTVTPDQLAPYFDRVEEHIHVEPVGEEILGNCGKLFRAGLEKMGLKGEPLLRNVKDCQGSGMCCFGCPVDAKQAVHLSYIPQAIEHGAKLYTHCRVEKINPRQGHGGEVIGFFRDPQTGRPGAKIRVDANVVVVAAGTLETPHLLRKNQIVLHNPHVGRHLTIHPASKVLALFDEEVRGWEGVPQGYAYYGMKEEGITFEGIFTPPSTGSISLELPAALHKEVMEKYRHIASFGFMVTDEGRGWIRWLPSGDPVAYYSITRHEVTKFIKGLRFLTEVFLNAGAKRVFTGLSQLPVVTPEMGVQAFDKLKVHRSDLTVVAFHPLGTCRMGEDPSQSVVNSFGEVHGVKNLFIADGSIFPSPLGVNPQESIMAFATRTADFIDRERL
ncbi:MAG: GMC family oxidoreductase [Deltaproteobacteria bacterium]|nr:GMC family oxidoreductase [Deltaproteobacteria bacterium]